ncbi:MAG: clan AA aspartic protease [Treponema sp.]|nr:clan AA aspartic protease [Treponema sp.]
MGIVHAEITIKNLRDGLKVDLGVSKEVRQTTVKAVVDTGAITLVITEAIRNALGLRVVEKRRATLANGQKEAFDVTESVNVHWKNRNSVCKAFVIPGAENVLLGAIPLEEMDLIVDPARQELTGAHGDEIVHLLL